MKYRLYSKTERAWDAMYEAIANAQHSIYWECYILLDNTKTHEFYQLLEKKAREGVRVRIVIDSIGTFWRWSLSRVQRSLQASGAEIYFFNRLVPWWNPVRLRNWWFMRNHRKVLIVDERVGFLGGVNVGEEFRQWLDIHVRVEGVIVRHLLRSFAYSYRISGGLDPVVLRLQRTAINNRWRRKAQSMYLAFSPIRTPSNRIRKIYEGMFAKAQKRITIVTPYFMPHGWFLEGLERARARGVDVRVLLPNDPRSRFVAVINRLYVCQAVRRGITVEYARGTRMNHTKALLIDDQEGMVGSANIDANSMDNNFEANVVFRRRDMVLRLKNIIRRWSKGAQSVQSRSLHEGIVHRLLERGVLFLHPYL